MGVIGGDTEWGPGLRQQMRPSEPWLSLSGLCNLGKLLNFSESHFSPLKYGTTTSKTPSRKHGIY